MLTKEQIEHMVKQVLPAINIYNSTRNTNHYTDEDIETLIMVWEKGIVFTNVVRGCNGCLKHVSDVIFSYAERNNLTAPVKDVEHIMLKATPKKRTKKK